MIKYDFAPIVKDIGQVLRVSGPLMLGMSAHTMMMLVDRFSLAAYSEDTLVASGPAVFTAMIVITFFRGITHVGRATIAEANAAHNQTAAIAEGGRLVLISLLCALGLIITFPIIIVINQLSARPEHIQALETTYLAWAIVFGIVMIFNNVGNCLFSGLLRTKFVFSANLTGQIIGAVSTYALVFGAFGLPELGMAGSAIGTLLGSLTILLMYVHALPPGMRGTLVTAIHEARTEAYKALKSRLRRGLPLGGEESADELGNTAILWAISLLGSAALAANNFNIILNYISIIPLIGIAHGATVLSSNAIGQCNDARIFRIVAASFFVSLCWIVLVAAGLRVFGPNFVTVLGVSDYSADIDTLTIAVSKLLWLYAIAFMLSQIGGAVLQSLNVTGFIFRTRIVLMWCGSVPTAFLIAMTRDDFMIALQHMWIALSLFEAAIGVVFFWRAYREIRSRKNINATL